MLQPSPPAKTIWLSDSIHIKETSSFEDICNGRAQLFSQYPNILDTQITLEGSKYENGFYLVFNVEAPNPELESLTKEYEKDCAKYVAWLQEEVRQRKLNVVASQAKREFKTAASQARKDKREAQEHIKKCLSEGNDTFIIGGKVYKLSEVK